MLDDDQDMADMYLGRRQDAENTKEEEKARQAIEPPSPTASAVSMDSIEAADFMGQSESDTEMPARPNRAPSPGDANFIRKSTPIQAQPPPQVCSSHKSLFLPGLMLAQMLMLRIDCCCCLLQWLLLSVWLHLQRTLMQQLSCQCVVVRTCLWCGSQCRKPLAGIRASLRAWYLGAS